MEPHADEGVSGSPYMVDDLLRLHVGGATDANVLIYPRVDGDLPTYEYYNSKRLGETVN